MNMKRSQIIIDLIRDDISVSQAMDILNVLLKEMKNEKIKKWLNNEINGYGVNDKVPEYRIVYGQIMGNVINYTLKVTNTNIPVKPEFKERFTKIEVKLGINDIVQLSIAEKETKNHSLTSPIELDVINCISLVEGQVTHAHTELSIYAHTNILNGIKNKLLDVFLKLEKIYGNLDNYYIDLSDSKTAKKAGEEIIKIVAGNTEYEKK